MTPTPPSTYLTPQQVQDALHRSQMENYLVLALVVLMVVTAIVLVDHLVIRKRGE